MKYVAPKKFWLRVATDLPDACWEWCGTCNVNGYGVTYFYQRAWLAHRVSWCLHNQRKIPAGLNVLHSCDNPPCVNPAHLRLGTQADNMADIRARHPRYIAAIARAASKKWCLAAYERCSVASWPTRVGDFSAILPKQVRVLRSAGTAQQAAKELRVGSFELRKIIRNLVDCGVHLPKSARGNVGARTTPAGLCVNSCYGISSYRSDTQVYRVCGQT